MLKEMHTVLPAADLQRAKAFYHDKLDLDPTDEVDGNLMYQPLPGSGFEIYETPNAGTAKNTQMVWLVDDLGAEMEKLRGRGIEFEDFEIPGMKTENGVVTTPDSKAAWFRDTEGNFLCITQMMRSSRAGGSDRMDESARMDESGRMGKPDRMDDSGFIE